MRASCLIACLVLTWSTTVEGAGFLDRRTAFLRIWDTITRQADPVRRAGYTDVPAGAPGERVLSFAKVRKITTEADTFRPDDVATEEDALIWLLRTRNVADPDDITGETVREVAANHGLSAWVEEDDILERGLSPAALERMIETLDKHLAAEVHEVSLYSEKFHGKGTAFGETFDMHALTAAHRTFPQHTLVKVTNVENGKSVTVRINDRGPFVHGRNMDLSLGSFTAIAPRSKGVIRATFQRLGDDRLIGPCRSEVAYQRRISRTVFLDPGMPRYTHFGQPIAFRANGSLAVLEVAYPDGSREYPYDWVLTGGEYRLQPSLPGEYAFLIRDRLGTKRWFRTTVVACPGLPKE